MISDLLFYALLLVGLLWLCLMLHHMWPSERVIPGSTRPPTSGATPPAFAGAQTVCRTDPQAPLCCV
jgi:hypothetical protein